MKKIMFAAVSALALSALADGVGSTQFGALTVVSKTKRTLVAIPWDNTAAGGGDIAVSNLVLTANLTEKDTLDAIGSDGASLCQWELTKGTDDVLYWKAPENTLDENENLGTGTTADVATIPRGSSIVLIRQSFTNETGAAIPFFVMGQVATTASSTTIVAPSAIQTNGCWNMVAPSSTEAQGLNGGDHGGTWVGTINAKDRIYIPNSPLNIELKYEDSVWKNQQTTTVTNYWGIYTEGGKTQKKSIEESDIPSYTKVITNKVSSTSWAEYKGTIPVGTGFWYLSKGGSPTVTWKDEPITTK